LREEEEGGKIEFKRSTSNVGGEEVFRSHGDSDFVGGGVGGAESLSEGELLGTKTFIVLGLDLVYFWEEVLIVLVTREEWNDRIGCEPDAGEELLVGVMVVFVVGALVGVVFEMVVVETVVVGEYVTRASRCARGGGSMYRGLGAGDSELEPLLRVLVM
jgi:hypothetical protein